MSLADQHIALRFDAEVNSVNETGVSSARPRFHCRCPRFGRHSRPATIPSPSLTPFRRELAPCTMGTIVRIVRKRLAATGTDDRTRAERVSRASGDHPTMSRSRPFASLQSTRGPGGLIAAFAVLGLALAAPPVAPAQFGGMGGAGGQSAVAQSIKIKSPVASQVFQRDVNGRGVIPIALDDSVKDATVLNASVVGDSQNQTMDNQLADRVSFFEGKLVGVPVGGPYWVNVTIKKGGEEVIRVGPVFVGDLWVLAGQSNMEGVGNLIDVTPPHPLVMNLGMNGKWARAEEPLHWLVDSPDPVHSGNPGDREKRSAAQHRTRAKGAGLGLPFATALVEQTRVPIGLVACAHGGTSMAQWNPAKKNEGGNSLYGSIPAPGAACRRQGQGRALVPGRERRQRRSLEELSPRLRRLHRFGPRRPESAGPTLLLRANRPFHQRLGSERLERRSGGPASPARARAQYRGDLGHRSRAGRLDSRGHSGPEARWRSAGSDRRA